MKNMIKRILSFFNDTKNFMCFLIKLLYHGSFINPIRKKYSGTVTILANGPSLKEILLHLDTGKEFLANDFIVMNFFALSEVFFKIKPRHYCLADPIFIKGDYDSKKDQVYKLFKALQEKVDWNLTIYIPGKYNLKKHLLYSNLNNPYIKHVALNADDYLGYKYFCYRFYKKGLAMPQVASVANMAIYVALNSGYSTINLYGADHNYFDSLCVNENNQLCNIIKHYYDNQEEDIITPLLDISGRAVKLADYLKANYELFRSHDILADYAKFLNVKIFNCTNGSMIDSYERKDKEVL
jgi:hypothetical protein